MGWRFLAQTTKKSKKLLNLEIFISPASCCLFPNTTVAVELQHPVINKPRRSVKIPTAPSDWHRVVLKKVTIHSLKFINILFSVTIQFRLPATAAISSPLQIAHSPRDKKLALSTLDGRNPVDIRFVLEGSKEVFGVSNLLRGRSDVLDKCARSSCCVLMHSINNLSVVDNEPQEDLSVGWDYDDDSDTEEDHLLSPAFSDSLSGISSLSSGYYPISAPNTLPSVPPPRPSDELPSPSSSRCIMPLTLETIRAHDASGDNIRTIIVKDVAYKTFVVFFVAPMCTLTFRLRFKTVLSYIYTDDDTFLSPNNTSPKSLYRLADRLHLIPLKTCSLVAIQDRLTTSNIVDETTSVFSSQYVFRPFLRPYLTCTRHFLVIRRFLTSKWCFSSNTSVMQMYHSCWMKKLWLWRKVDLGTGLLR